MRKVGAPGLLIAALLLLGPVDLLAHAVVYPSTAPTGAYQKYVLRVPNERTLATTRVEIIFPEAVRVISFDQVPGWALETVAAEDGVRFLRAVWTGSLPPGRFVEFGFIGVNPAEETVVTWDVIQTYGEDEAVAWTGPADSSTPASRTSIRANPRNGAAVGAAGSTGGAGSAEAGSTDGDLADWLNPGTALGASALVIALIGLGLALRPSGGH